MRKSKFLAAVLAALLTVASPVAYAGEGIPPPGLAGHTFGSGPTGWWWAIFGCTSGIILAALVANYQQNRQLTWNEAATCGFLFWFTPPRRP